MPKAYWITFYREIKDPAKLAAYAKLAPAATAPFGAKYIARGTAAAAYEFGQKERVVVTEFESLAKAIAAHDSAGLSRSGESARRRRGTRRADDRGAGVVAPLRSFPRKRESRVFSRLGPGLKSAIADLSVFHDRHRVNPMFDARERTGFDYRPEIRSAISTMVLR